MVGRSGSSRRRGGMIVATEIENRFRFHPANTPEKQAEHSAVRVRYRELAAWVEANLPHSRERSLALTALQESMMWCNACVAYVKEPEHGDE